MTMKNFNYTPNIHFYNLGISDTDKEKDDSSAWKMRTLVSIYKMLQPNHGSVPIDYLKVDVEGHEWRIFPQLLRSGILDKVKQLGFELHFDVSESLESYRNKIELVKSLEEYGMVRFTSRVNIFTKSPIAILGGHEDYTCHEIAWYNSKFLV